MDSNPAAVILVKDTVGFKHMVKRIFGSPWSSVRVLRGELLKEYHHEEKKFNYVLQKDPPVFLKCADKDVVTLFTQEKFMLMKGIEKLVDRFAAFTDGILDFGMSLEIGSSVFVNTDKMKKKLIRATVHYIGEVQGYQGFQFGVELEQKIERGHNGTVSGVSYFHCKDGHGKFVPLNRLVKYSDEEYSIQSSSSSQKPENVTPMRHKGDSNHNDSRFKNIRSRSNPENQLSPKNNDHEKIEGEHSCTVSGVSYFHCKNGHGKFVPLNSLVKNTDEMYNRRILSSCQEPRKTSPLRSTGDSSHLKITRSISNPENQQSPSMCKVGDRVRFLNKQGQLSEGTVQWIETSSMSRNFEHIYVGINTDNEVNAADYENSKSGLGHLLDAPTGRVLFIPESMVNKIEQKESKRDMKESIAAKSVEEINHTKHEILDEQQKCFDFTIGSMVQLCGANTYGILRWIGTLPNVTEQMAGIELEEYMEGCTNGSWNDQNEKSYKFFSCEDGKGVYYPVKSLTLDARVPRPSITHDNYETSSSSSEATKTKLTDSHDSYLEITLNEKVNTISKLISEVNHEMEELTKMKQSYKANWHSSEEKLQKSEEKLQKNEEKLQKSEEKLQKSEEKLQKSEEKLQKSEEKLQKSEEKLQKSEEKLQKSEEKLQKSEEKIQKNEEKLQKSEEKIQKNEEMLQTKVEEIKSHLQVIASKEKEGKDFQSTIEKLNEKLKAYDNMYDESWIQISQDSVPSWKIDRSVLKSIPQTYLGVGAWGVVYSAEFKGEQVAIKHVHKELLSVRCTVQIVKREISILARIHHPNLVRFIGAVLDSDVESERDVPIIVLEQLDMNLRTAYANENLSQAMMASIFCDVAYALHYLHEQTTPIIHRDVSAPNILLKKLPNHFYRAKVSDFGSANLARQSTTAGAGAIIYTAPEMFPQEDFMAEQPEQTVKVDVYSFGVVMLEVACQEMPFPEKRRALSQTCESRWKVIYDLVRQCTRVCPHDRPTMREILEHICRI